MTTTKIWKITIPKSLDEVWEFFLDPNNLNSITPSEFRFRFISNIKNIDEMYEGMIIKYKVSPFKGIRLNWVTEITKVVKLSYFVDEQRIGPYKMWHHEHHFIKINDTTTEMIDILNYKVGKGIFGTIINKILVENKINWIFEYRRKAIEELFNPKNL